MLQVHYTTERNSVVKEMKGAEVTTVMVMAQFLSVGSSTLIKASMSRGMSNFVFVAYSNLVAFCLLLLATIIHHRLIFCFKSKPLLLRNLSVFSHIINTWWWFSSSHFPFVTFFFHFTETELPHQSIIQLSSEFLFLTCSGTVIYAYLKN